jgi:hypothetical protein
LNSFSNEIIKNLFLNVNRQTEALTLVLSCVVEREKEQNFLKTPLTFILSRKGREEMEEKILNDPSPYPLPRGGEGRMEMKGI